MAVKRVVCMIDKDSDREARLFHGTTFDVAQKVLAQKAFELRETYFASTRELAELFATRTSRKHSIVRAPAVIVVVLYESDLKSWQRNKLVATRGFSDGDRPEFRGQTQMVFSAEAVRFLNRDMFSGDLAIEAVQYG